MKYVPTILFLFVMGTISCAQDTLFHTDLQNSRIILKGETIEIEAARVDVVNFETLDLGKVLYPILNFLNRDYTFIDTRKEEFLFQAQQAMKRSLIADMDKNTSKKLVITPAMGELIFYGEDNLIRNEFISAMEVAHFYWAVMNKVKLEFGLY